ncbi:MAG TPA: SAF domain-containing protein [Dermatophilaceae bacterium]|nr:SAF domain-containing protein [Dermatophilaceae bacterium]
MLPGPLRGTSRRAAYRRSQARRAVAALLAAAAVWLVLDTLLPDPRPAGDPVLVAASALPAGHVLTSGDLREARWPPALRPAAALSDAARLIGQTLASGIDPGEVITSSRVRGAGLLSAAPPGMLAARVPLSDPGTARLVAAGDRVDLVAPATGAVLIRAAAVLAVDQAGSPGGGLLGNTPVEESAGIVVAVDESTAVELARTTAGGAGVFVVLRRPGQ